MPIKHHRNNSGLTALPVILIITGIIVEIVMAMALVAVFIGNSGYASRQSAKALIAAEAGVKDAAMRITRDNDYTGNYSFSVGGTSVTVDITQVSQKRQVVSTGDVGFFSKAVQAVYLVNDDGEVVLETYQEIAQ